jgi:hypothetical protein
MVSVGPPSASPWSENTTMIAFDSTPASSSPAMIAANWMSTALIAWL